MNAWRITMLGLAALCGLSAAIGFVSWAFPRRKTLAASGRILGIASCLACVVVWLIRTWRAGHLPLFGTFESALSLACATLVAAALLRDRERDGPGLWPPSCVVVAILLIHGGSYDPSIFPLTISERSWVVDLHAIAAWAAFGSLALNAGFALLVLAGRAGATSWVGRRLGTTLSLGFLLHSLMLASGSFYKFLLFGKAWSFDPVETLGLVAWACYGTLLHMHLISGWDGRRLAGWCVVVFLVLTATYRGIVYFPAWSTYHIFDMDLREHVMGGGSPEGGGP